MVVVVVGGGGGGGWGVEVCVYIPLMHTSNLSWILDIFCSCPAMTLTSLMSISYILEKSAFTLSYLHVVEMAMITCMREWCMPSSFLLLSSRAWIQSYNCYCFPFAMYVHVARI